MYKLIVILLLISCSARANCLKDTVPTGVPQLFGSKFYEFKNYCLVDSFIMNAAGDTNLIPYYPSIKFKSSRNRWYGWNRSRWIDFLNSLDTISLSNRINNIQLPANNGLTKSGDTVQLGGALIKPTSVLVGTNEFDVIADDGGTSSTRFSIDNTNAIFSGIYNDARNINNLYVNPDNIQLLSLQPTGSRRILMDTTTGIQIQENVSGVYYGFKLNKGTGNGEFLANTGLSMPAFSISNQGDGKGLITTAYNDNAIEASSNAGVALFGQSAANVAGVLYVTPVSGNTEATCFQIGNATSGTADDGIGVRMDFYNRDQVGFNLRTNQLVSKFTDAHSGFGSEATQFILRGFNAGTESDLLTINGNGQHRLNQYMPGSFETTDTSMRSLLIDASGNIWQGTSGGDIGTLGLQNVISNNHNLTLDNNIQNQADKQLQIITVTNPNDSIYIQMNASRVEIEHDDSIKTVFADFTRNNIRLSAVGFSGNGGEYRLDTNYCRYYETGDSVTGIEYNNTDTTNWQPGTLTTLDYVRSRFANIPPIILTSTQLAYGSGSNAITSEAALNYNATNNSLSSDSLRSKRLSINTDTLTGTQIVFGNTEDNNGNDSVGQFGIAQIENPEFGYPRKDVVWSLGYNDPQSSAHYKPHAGTFSLHLESDFFGQSEFILGSITHGGFSTRHMFGHFSKFTGASDFRWSISNNMQWFEYDTTSNPYMTLAPTGMVVQGPGSSFRISDMNLHTGVVNGSFSIAPQSDGSVTMGTGTSTQQVQMSNFFKVNNAASQAMNIEMTASNSYGLFINGTFTSGNKYPILIQAGTTSGLYGILQNVSTGAGAAAYYLTSSAAGGGSNGYVSDLSGIRQYFIQQDQNAKLNFQTGTGYGGSNVNLMTFDPNGYRVGFNKTSPGFGHDISATVGLNKDSVPQINTIGTNLLLTVDSATGQVKRILSSSLPSVTTLYTGDGTLSSDRTVTGGANGLTFTSTRTGATATINNTSTGRGLDVSTGSATGVRSVANSGIGVHGISTSNYGLRGESTSSPGLYAISNSASGAQIQTNQTSTNDNKPILEIYRLSQSAGANNISGSIDMYINNTVGAGTTVLANQIISKLPTATSSSETSQLIIKGINSGSQNTVATFDGNANATFGTTNSIVGTATNNNAVAGNIGEEVNSTVSTYTNYSSSAAYQNIASITLSAGDWDISAQGTFSSNSATITAAGNAIFVISTTTASASGATEGKNIAYIPQATLLGTSFESTTIAPYRVSISGSTTYYLNSQATFTIGNPQFVGAIRARRMR